MNLAIIGMRGVGKSNISRRIALLTKRPALSTDLLVEYESGTPIAEFVAQHGWREFRELEYLVVQRVSALQGVIVDCGGGVVVELDDNGDEGYSDRKVAALKAGGPVVWLQGDIERLAAKSAGDPSRPVLDPRRAAVDLMHRRLPYYERAADLVVDVEGKRRSQVATEIVQWAHDLQVPGMD